MQADELFSALREAVSGALRRADAAEPVLAYSGGLDSTVLLHTLHALGLPFQAVHVNHGLQPAAPDWERHCSQEAAQLGVPFHGLRVQVHLNTGLGLEAAAREARYRAIAQSLTIALDRGSKPVCVLTAHHQDDQLETVLLQLFRGSGLRGLAGMAPCSDWPVDSHLHPELKLLRPLLGFKRADLEALAEAKGWAHIEDPSNQDHQLRRNWLRQVLLPELNTQFPQAEQGVLRLSAFVTEHFNGLDSQVQAALPGVWAPDSGLDLKAFRQHDTALRLELLRFCLLQAGVRCGSAPLQEMNRQLDLTEGGKRQVAKGWFMLVSRHRASIHLEAPSSTKDPSRPG